MTTFFPLAGIFPSRNGGGDDGGSFIGEIGIFAGNFAPNTPLAAGQLLQINQNTAVFSILGTTYGGNGQTNFALPNLTSTTMIGAGQGPGLSLQTEGVPTGSSSINLTSAQKPADIGGTSQPFGNYQPSLPINYIIHEFGVFPSQGGGGARLDIIGAVVPFAGNFAPDGWAICDGSLLQIADNDVLFQLIGTTYGGDGQTTFALPDLRGRDIIGASGINPIGTVIGQDKVSLTNNQAPDGRGDPVSPFNNMQPSLAMTYLIAEAGIFPSQGGTGGSINSATPYLGEIIAFAGNFAPGGWAVASGQLLPINQNQALFSLLGTQYGGNGQTTFALPDLRDRTIVGAGNGLAVGTAFGSNGVTVTSADLPTTSYVVSGGQTSVGLTLFIGDTLTVLSGGVASGTVVDAAASGTVSAGGIVRGNQVNGGVQTVFGAASNTLLLSGAVEIVSSGGVASGTTVSSGSVQVASSGGLVVSTIVRSGGLFGEVAGGVASAEIISNGGEELVTPGGIAIGGTISNGGLEYVYSGGIASNTTIANGGTLELQGGALVSGVTTRLPGSIEEIIAGYTLNGFTVQSGVTLEVGAGGVASGAVVLSGGTLELLGGASAQAPTFSAGATLVIGSGYTQSGFIASSGRTLMLSSGGIGSATTLSGGLEIVSSGGVVRSGVVMPRERGRDSPAAWRAARPSTATPWQYVLAGGSASGTSVGNDGVQVVFLRGRRAAPRSRRAAF